MSAPKSQAGPRTAFVTVDDFAKALSVSPSTVRNAINRGEVHTIRFARAVRIPVSEFERLGYGIPAFLLSENGEVA